MEKIQEEQLRKMLVEQRAQIEKLQQENMVLTKAVDECSRSMDSVLAVVAAMYGSNDEYGCSLLLSEDEIKNALNDWKVTARRVEGAKPDEHNLLVDVRRRE
jgi:DNA polymerase III sliding clamp (beta) subunit (PCNA family)